MGAQMRGALLNLKKKVKKSEKFCTSWNYANL